MRLHIHLLPISPLSQHPGNLTIQKNSHLERPWGGGLPRKRVPLSVLAKLHPARPQFRELKRERDTDKWEYPLFCKASKTKSFVFYLILGTAARPTGPETIQTTGNTPLCLQGF